MDRYKLIIRCSLLLLCVGLLTGGIQEQHRAIIGLNRGTSTPTPCGLLSDTMENTDAVNSTAHTPAWIADGTDPGDDIEIDNTEFHGGSTSMLIAHDVNSNIRNVYKTFTAQATGKWTVSLWFNRTFVNASNNFLVLTLANGAVATTANLVLTIRSFGDDLDYDTTGLGVYTTLCNPCVAADTWHRLEIELDQDANVWDAWIDTTTQIANNIAFINNIDADRYYIRKNSTGATNTNSWLDDVCITDGAR